MRCNGIRYIRLFPKLETRSCSTGSTFTWGGGSTRRPWIRSFTTGSKSEIRCTWWIRINADRSDSYADEDIQRWNLNGPNDFQSNSRTGLLLPICWEPNHTWESPWIFGEGISPWFAPSSYTTWLCVILAGMCSSFLSCVAGTLSALPHCSSGVFVWSHADLIRGLTPCTA